MIMVGFQKKYPSTIEPIHKRLIVKKSTWERHLMEQGHNNKMFRISKGARLSPFPWLEPKIHKFKISALAHLIWFLSIQDSVSSRALLWARRGVILSIVWNLKPSLIKLAVNPLSRYSIINTSLAKDKLKSQLTNLISGESLFLIAKLSLTLSSVHWLSSSIFTCLSVRMVTSPFISTVWCSRPYKPYIF